MRGKIILYTTYIFFILWESKQKKKKTENYTFKAATLRASANNKGLKGEGHEGKITIKSEEEINR